MAGDAPEREASERALFSAPPPEGLFPLRPRTDGAVSPRPSPPVPAGISAATGSGARRSIAAIGSGLRSSLALEVERGTPFVLAPVPLAAGALSYYGLASEPDALPLALGLFLLLPLVVATVSRPVWHAALAALLLFVAGIACARLETWRAGTKMLGGEITTLLTGRVVAVEPMAGGRVRLTLDVEGTARPALRYAPDRVRASARRVPEGTAPGALVSGLVRLMPPSGPVRPGSYDFSFESYFDGIGASGFFLRDPELAAQQGIAPWGSRWRAAVERARENVAARIRERIGGAEGEIAAALTVGVRAGIPEEVNEALRRAGIYHVISISGLHMALVAGTVMGLLRLGFAAFPGFATRRPVKKYAAVIAIGALAAYLFVSGADVAAQRSFLMLAVMLTALLFDRAALTMRNLAISALVVIAVSPHEVVGPSFQMSFAATAALVGAYALWAERAERRRRRVPSRSLPMLIGRKAMLAVAGLAATSIVAGGATAVYSAWHFQQMPSLGLFTNLTAMPVVSVLVMPFAVLAMLAMPFGLDGPFLDVMGFGLAVMLAIARWFAERSPLDMVRPVSAAAVAMLTVALLVASVPTTRLRLAALPLALAGLLMLRGDPPPDMLVSEDARLVAVGLGEGAVAVNRPRPNGFTIDNWKRAMLADTVLRPGEAGFLCADGMCVAKHPSGLAVAHAVDADAAIRACPVADVLVVDDASVRASCSDGGVVVSGRDLARRGSAAVRLTPSGPEVTHAVREPYRPWHEHRRFSRAARGLAPYRPVE